MDPSIRGQLLGEGRAQQLTDKWRAAAARNRPDHWPGATVSQGLIRLRHQQQVGQLIGQADAHGQQQSQHEGQQVGPTCWQQVGQQQPQQSQQAGQQQRLCGVQQMQQLGRQQESHAQHQDVAADGGDRPQRSSQQSKQPPQQPPL
jgi:hypothetical protein